MEPIPPPRRRRAPVDAGLPTRTAIASILGFWLVYFVVVTLRAGLLHFDGQIGLAERRGVVVLVGAAITAALYRALAPFARAALGRRITAAALLSLPAAAVFASFIYAAFYVYAPMAATRIFVRREDDGRTVLAAREAVGAQAAHRPASIRIAEGTLDWYFFFAAWAALHIAIGYAGEVRAAERRSARFRATAREAELRALRYQINPHFLFNTLNTLSSLVLSDRRDEAERMIVNLSTFFRTTLSAEPVEDVTLAEEIGFQRLYLDIEAVRFPERLTVVIDVPEALETACVPSLILQPLVENALKHGVARTGRPVTLSIRARTRAHAGSGGADLRLTVEDDAVPAGQAPPVPGHGLGLRNVRDRLKARHGDAGEALWTARAEGGFAVTLDLPLVRRG